MEFNTPSPAVRYGRVFILTLANLSWNLFPLLIGCRQLLNIPYFISVRNVKKWKLNILMNLPSIFFHNLKKKLFVQRWITEVTLHHVFEKLQRIQLAATKSILQKYIHTLLIKYFLFSSNDEVVSQKATLCEKKDTKDVVRQLFYYYWTEC